MENIEIPYLIALIGGMFSFLSPCVLPLVPAYICFITGNSYQDLRDGDKIDKWAMLWPAIAFVLGFSTVFIALGAGASFVQGVLLEYKEIFAQISGAMIIILGIHFTGLVKIPFLYREARFQTDNEQRGLTGAYVIGLAFAFGWTPCIGPILGAILAVAGAQQDISHGIILLALYSAGLGIPFLLAALATDAFLNWSQRFKRHLHIIEITSGILLMVVGALIFLGSFSILSGFIIEYMPWLSNIEATFSG
ncbi:MAG: cytochrome C biogenesis protein [Alphaproteobacteria bacterium]|nr:MAG: cytochrome C biogenesis protein [Alphaproteobacteria bacterium]